MKANRLTLPLLITATLSLAGCGLKPGLQSAPLSNSLLPLAASNTWYYNVQALGNGGYCATGTQTQRVNGQTVAGGTSGFLVAPLCQQGAPVAFNVTGDLVQWYYQGRWTSYLDAPVTDAHAWNDGATNWVWMSVAQVVVKAGTYTNCWMRQQTSIPNVVNYSTFCRGVGMVVSHYADGGGNGWDAQLVSKNF